MRSAIREHLKSTRRGLRIWQSRYWGRGLSVRDIEDAFRDENGRLLLSKTPVLQLGEPLLEAYQAFAQRDLSEHEITYLFVDGIAERLRAWRQTRAGSGGLGLQQRPMCASSWPPERNGREAHPTFCRSASMVAAMLWPLGPGLAGQRAPAHSLAGCAGLRPRFARLGLRSSSAARGGWERGPSG